MLNKNDPLVSAIQDVMRKNQAERDAVKAVNEKFGVQDRRVLPRERQGEWDAAYKSVLTEGVEALDEKSDIDHPNKRKLDVAKPFGDLTSADFKKLRSMEEEGDPSKAIPGDTVTGSGTVTPVKPKPKATEITSDQKAALTKKIETIKEAKKAAMYEGGMEKTMGEFKRGTLHSGSKTGPIVKSREQAIAIGMNNEETVNRTGKGNLQEPQSVGSGKGNLPTGTTSVNNNAPGPSFERTGRGSAPVAPAVKTNSGISALNKSTSSAPNPQDRINAVRRQVPTTRTDDLGKAPVPGTGGRLAPRPAAPESTPVAGPNRGLGPKPAAPGSAPAAKAPDSTQKSTTTKPGAKKIIKPVRKQPPAGAATRPATKDSTINKMRQNRLRDKNNTVGPGN
jgi:hypothetical protein